MEDHQLIAAYFDNELSNEERKAFESRKENDASFAKEIATYQLIIQEIKEPSRQVSMKEKMRRWDEEEAEEEIKPASPFRSWKVAAVVFPLLLAAGTAYYFMTNKQEPAELYTAYFKPYEDVFTNRSAVEVGFFEKAMAAYNSGAYEQAIVLFEQVQKEEGVRHGAAKLYQAMCSLMMENTEHSEKLLKEAQASGNPLLIEVSEWYLLLVYLKENNVLDANRQINAILKNDSHMYVKDAKKLNADWDRD